MRTFAELSNLTGRKALITGGAGHIALATADVLVELGATVTLSDTNIAECEQRALRFRKKRDKSAFALACDLREESSIRKMVADAIEQMKGLDLLIHCAAHVGTTSGSGWAVPFDDQTVEAWNAALAINVTSAFVMAQAGKDALRESGHGSIVLFASIYGIVGPDMSLYEGTTLANPAGYGSSKGALLQLTRHLATILAPQIRVNSISPGGVWRQQPKIFHERYNQRTPLDRMATEEDFKGAVAYLASDLSSYVTGHNLVVDGGWTAW